MHLSTPVSRMLTVHWNTEEAKLRLCAGLEGGLRPDTCFTPKGAPLFPLPLPLRESWALGLSVSLRSHHAMHALCTPSHCLFEAFQQSVHEGGLTILTGRINGKAEGKINQEIVKLKWQVLI